MKSFIFPNTLTVESHDPVTSTSSHQATDVTMETTK